MSTRQNKYLVGCLWALPLLMGCQPVQEIAYPYSFKARTNPWVKHIRTADPDAHVWNDGRLWVYTSQDHPTDEARATKAWHVYNRMDGYHAFSTENMVDWIDHGELLHSKNVAWGLEEGGFMWAPGAAYKNGTYYLYFPHMDKNKNFRIGVATSKSPAGPFIAEPQYIEGTSGIDPMCFIDDDGQAYLYFGKCQVAKLSDDMLRLAESPRTLEYGNMKIMEGAYMHKRNGIYYYSFTNHKEEVDHGFYSMGHSPYGPFDYKGAINPKPPGAQDHHSIVEFKGQWYYFYHIGDYVNTAGVKGNGHMRNVCVDFLEYNADGTITPITQTEGAVFK